MIGKRHQGETECDDGPACACCEEYRCDCDGDPCPECGLCPEHCGCPYVPSEAEIVEIRGDMDYHSRKEE